MHTHNSPSHHTIHMDDNCAHKATHKEHWGLDFGFNCTARDGIMDPLLFTYQDSDALDR